MDLMMMMEKVAIGDDVQHRDGGYDARNRSSLLAGHPNTTKELFLLYLSVSMDDSQSS